MNNFFLHPIMSVFENQYGNDTHIVRGIEFSLLDPNEIKAKFNKLGEEVDHRKYHNFNKDQITGKYIDLEENAVPYIQYKDILKEVLKMTCRYCGVILFYPEMHDKIISRKLCGRRKHIYKLFEQEKKKTANKRNICWNCNKTIYLTLDIREQADKPFHYKVLELDKEEPEYLDGAQIIDCLKKISDKDARILGFGKNSRPEWLICTVLPIMNDFIRPKTMREGLESIDDMTYMLDKIHKCEKITKNNAKNLTQFQRHVSDYIDKSENKEKRGGRPITSIYDRLKYKNGRIRGTLAAKRVIQSARSVITPDADLDMDEIGVPEEICRNLSIPVRVTESNIEELKKLIMDNKVTSIMSYDPRSQDLNIKDCYIEKEEGHKYKQTIRLQAHKQSKKGVKTETNISEDLEENVKKLKCGDIVHRQLLQDDIILLNRAPTLQRVSMMAHRVHPTNSKHHKTLSLPVVATTPYNADFDGDEMNIHIGQSIESRNELEHLANINKNIRSAKDGSMLITLVQDTLL
jgi:DNA-directed RNA polymerase subunit A'